MRCVLERALSLYFDQNCSRSFFSCQKRGLASPGRPTDHGNTVFFADNFALLKINSEQRFSILSLKTDPSPSISVSAYFEEAASGPLAAGCSPISLGTTASIPPAAKADVRSFPSWCEWSMNLKVLMPQKMKSTLPRRALSSIEELFLLVAAFLVFKFRPSVFCC
jgi:hypothetical protein